MNQTLWSSPEANRISEKIGRELIVYLEIQDLRCERLDQNNAMQLLFSFFNIKYIPMVL